VLSTRKIIKRIEDHGADVETSTPERFGELVKSELVKWKAVVQKAKLAAE
jgi:tripartite-type tricarboxylate transporter receptor subunit TctC